MVNIAGQLIQKLKQLGPDAVVDMDTAAQRESMVTLRVLGFNVVVLYRPASHRAKITMTLCVITPEISGSLLCALARRMLLSPGVLRRRRT